MTFGIYSYPPEFVSLVLGAICRSPLALMSFGAKALRLLEDLNLEKSIRP